jgi:2-polyprenyl-3-methyl-5-hydroxy-6-metoxy-1,4-benzoquinol methylase
MAESRQEGHQARLCPWWLMYLFDHRLRRLFQPTGPVIDGLVAPGDSCLDVGCGMGYFTIPMAHVVGPAGRVTAVDLQPRMLEGAARRAKREGVADRISLHAPGDSEWVVSEGYDFILAFWMLHEVREPESFLRTLRSVLKPSGSFLLVEPRLHVREKEWNGSLGLAAAAGFGLRRRPVVSFSRAAILQ